MRIIDLTHPINEGMPTFAALWHPPVEITILGRHDVEGRATRKISFGTHTGTHVDAPLHFIKDGSTIDMIALETLAGKALVIPLMGKGPGGRVERKDLENYFNGRTDVKRVILRFDWSNRFRDGTFYINWPYLSMEAAEFLLEQGVKLIGMDTPSPDNPSDGPKTGVDSPVHKLLMGQGVILVEYLNGLEQIKSLEIEFIALPIKITGSDGAPARCIAIER